jgi:hypothetical protein
MSADKDLIDMNTRDFLRLGVSLEQATRLATDFVARFILSGRAFRERGISFR